MRIRTYPPGDFIIKGKLNSFTGELTFPDEEDEKKFQSLAKYIKMGPHPWKRAYKKMQHRRRWRKRR